MVEIEDTFCEAFDGLFSRILITAKDEKRLKRAAYGTTALPSTVFGKSEGGIEKWLSKEETLDGRKGVIIQIWVNYGKKAKDKLEYELGWRIRQGILVVPSTSVFNALFSNEKIDVMEKVGHCGDRAVEAISKIDGVITPFDVCSAGSKLETNFPEIGPTTNHPYCPTLRDKIGNSSVPEGVNYIPEIVINGTSLDAVKEAMRTAISSVGGMEGVIKISAGNYGGKLGKYCIYLRDLV
jgi:formylmethanofuran--tetrahydromethanopterin N-formyltransferase